MGGFSGRGRRCGTGDGENAVITGVELAETPSDGATPRTGGRGAISTDMVWTRLGWRWATLETLDPPLDGTRVSGHIVIIHMLMHSVSSLCVAAGLSA